MPSVADTTAIRYIAYDPSSADRIDGIEPGIHVYAALGEGATPQEARRDACRRVGTALIGLSIGRTTSPDVGVGKGASRYGKTGTLFTRLWSREN